MPCNYKTLLQIKRRRRRVREYDIAIESESDRGRVLYCKAFRRLQGKTQVFPLEANASVRTRLTHSLEVSHLGRQIAERILFGLSDEELKKFCIDEKQYQIAFVNFVETACLLHDIGNPPFGHFGEKAIQEWFKRNGYKTFARSLNRQRNQPQYQPLPEDETQLLNAQSQMPILKCFFDNLINDFLEFDGNPQGFRIITRLLWNVDRYALNLTFSQMAAFLKYMRTSNQQSLKDRPFMKKSGFFVSEKKIVEELRNTLGITENNRFPLTYIMEAADDIAYCISDIEDGLEKKLFSINFFKRHIKDEWNKIVEKLEEKGDLPENFNKRYLCNLIESSINDETQEQDLDGYFSFKIKVTVKLLEYAVRQFSENHEPILEGTYPKSLLGNISEETVILDALKNFARNHLYTQRDAEDIELAGYRIITGLLRWFEPLLCCSRSDFQKVINNEKSDKLDLEKRLYHMLPDKHKLVYDNAIKQIRGEEEIIDYEIDNIEELEDAYEWFFRAHLILDYISGMTDSYALKKYQLYSGIRVN